VDQRALGELAERAAEIAERGMGAGDELTRLVHQAAREHRYAPWVIVSMIGQEWDRLGIRRVPAATALAEVPRGTVGIVVP
jgi:hypothetical protein